MQSITVQSHVGEDGILRLQIPVGVKDTDLQIIINLPPSSTANSGWPPGYLERVIGSWQGEFPVLEDEGDYETRKKLP